MTVLTRLTELRACGDAIKWVEAQPVQSEAALWRSCPRGDWLIWWAAKCGAPRKELLLAACACARTALRFVPAGEDRPRLAIEAAERVAEKDTPENRDAAEAAAWAIVYANTAAADSSAAAAAYAAATNSARAAEAAAAYAAAGAARAEAHKQCADIVRTIIVAEAFGPEPVGWEDL